TNTVIDWGDGITSTGTVSYNSGTQTYSVTGSHTYTDNHQPSGPYTVTVTVHDAGGGVGSATTSIVVNNVAPTASLAGPTTALPGQYLTFTGSYDDAGTGDLPTEVIAWKVTNSSGVVVAGGASGNGTVVGLIGVYQSQFSFALSTAGSYTLSFRV